MKLFKIFYTILISTILFTFTDVFAFNTTVTGTNYINSNTSSFNVVLHVSGAVDLTTIQANVSFDASKLNTPTVHAAGGWSTSYGTKLAGTYSAGLTGSSDVAVFTFTPKAAFVDGDSTTISFTNVYGANSDVIKQTGTNASITVSKVNNYLSSLSLSTGSFNQSFNKNTLNYTATIDAASVEILATAEVASSTISGKGVKSLSYGTNNFDVLVTDKLNSKKTYHITITRPDNRSTDNTLKTLNITNTNFSFDGKTSYNLTVENNVSSVNVSATANDTKASIVSGTGNHTLKVGNNTISVVVKAENEVNKTYTVNITRKAAETPAPSEPSKPSSNTNTNTTVDNKPTVKSSENHLSSLTIAGTTISLDNSNVSYKIEVPYEQKKSNVLFSKVDRKSVVEVKGNGSLQVGENEIVLEVTAEDGTKRTYTVLVVRAESSNPTEKEETPVEEDEPIEVVDNTDYTNTNTVDNQNVVVTDNQSKTKPNVFLLVFFSSIGLAAGALLGYIAISNKKKKSINNIDTL